MIDTEFERKGRAMSDKLNQIIDLEYTWGDFPAVTAEQIYNRYDVVRETAQLRAELQFQRQQVQDLSATAEYYRALVQEARDERDAAMLEV